VVYLRGREEDLLLCPHPAASFVYFVLHLHLPCERAGANTHCWATERFATAGLKKSKFYCGKCF
jgi:hypothetical protein